MAVVKICSTHGCPESVVRLNRCARHAAELDRKQAKTTPTKVARTQAERRRRKLAVAKHRKTHGGWCPGYKRAPHEAYDLTAEHGAPLADGGSIHQSLEVLCRSCNSRHGAETRNALYQKM